MFKFLLSAKTSVKILVVVALLIFLHYIRILAPVENLLIRVFAPIQHQVYSLGASFNNFYSGFSSSKDLKEENTRLQEELRNLVIENSQLLTLIKNQSETSIQQAFLESIGLKAVSARVIGKNPEANFQSIIIDKGSQQGVSPDQPLITGSGLLVGKISQVRNNSAEAILINDSRSKVAAVIQNESGSQGVVVGEHGLSLKMELIPQNEKVSVGDLVVTSGIEPAVARGLIIGEVVRVETEPNGFFQTAFLQPLVKIDNLTVVSVLVSPAL